MNEFSAQALFAAAIREGRSAELLDALFDGGSAMIDTNGTLMIVTGAQIEELVSR
jgi:hypothetical protein